MYRIIRFGFGRIVTGYGQSLTILGYPSTQVARTSPIKTSTIICCRILYTLRIICIILDSLTKYLSQISLALFFQRKFRFGHMSGMWGLDGGSSSHRITTASTSCSATMPIAGTMTGSGSDYNFFPTFD